MRKREKTKRCIYSDSCFKCPLSDCRMNTPAQLNCLPLDFEPDTKNFKVVEDSKADDEIVYAKSVLDRRIREIVGEDNFSPFDERYGRR